MEKGMSIGAMVVAGLLFIVFLMDLIAGFPFSDGTPPDKDSPFMLVDIFGILGCGIVAYLGWNAYRENK